MSGSSGGTQTSTQKATPWGPQGDYLKKIMQQAEGLYQQPGPGYYPGQTTVPFAPETAQSLAMQAQRASEGSPLTQAAKTNVLTTLGGGNQNPYMQGVQQTAQTGGVNPYMQGVQQTASGAGMNPYLDSMFAAASRPLVQQFQTATAPGIAGRFLKAGRWGSGAMADEFGRGADVLAQNLAGLGANIYGQGYESERNRQVGAQGQLAGLGESQLGRQFGAQTQLAGIGESALGRQQDAMRFAPQLAMTDYNDIAQLGNVGAAREDLGERQIGENMARYQHEQQLPGNKLAQFLQFVQGNYGGTQTMQQPVYRNRPAGAFGGALGGAAMFPAAPWLGAIGGGLLGAFA